MFTGSEQTPHNRFMIRNSPYINLQAFGDLQSFLSVPGYPGNVFVDLLGILAGSAHKSSMADMPVQVITNPRAEGTPCLAKETEHFTV